MAVRQGLGVTEVANSQNIVNNTSQVRIEWVSVQTGDSYNGYERTAKYYISINGGAETEYTVKYTLPKNTTKTIVDKTITVPHKEDGSGTIRVRTWMDTDISAGVLEMSQNTTLATIPRVSVPTLSARSIDLGKEITVYTNRKSSNFTHHLYYSINGGADIGVTDGIGDSYTWKASYDLMSHIPNDRQMTITFRVYTFSGNTNIGNNTISFTAYVPSDSNTQPKITVKELKPISSLSSPFNALFIQGKSKVKVDFTAEGAYGSSIESCSVSVEGETYKEADDFTSEYLSRYGTVDVTITATDKRGITGSIVKKINVIAYSKPKIGGIDDNTDIICARCDAEGNLTDSGTYLKVRARRSYSKVMSEENQKNFCAIIVKYRPSNGEFTEWQTILAKDDVTTNTIDSEPLLDGALAVDTSYVIQIGVKDDIGEEVYVTFNIPTDKIDSHEGNGFLALGKYSEKDGFECAWNAEFYRDVTIQGGKIIDFPIEEGTDDIWTYRKWHSGIAECWGRCSVDVSISNPWGNPCYVYFGEVREKTFPSELFISIPNCHISAEFGKKHEWAWLAICGLTTKETAPPFILCSPYTAPDANFDILYYAIGKWK